MSRRNSASIRQSAGADSPAGAEIAQFVRDLHEAQRRRQRVSGRGSGELRADDPVVSLALADATFRLARDADAAARPPQVAVIGPTQVGKSTIVDLLVGAGAAQVSPLAGFTVHPHALLTPGAEEGAWADALFPGWQRVPAEHLDREQLEAYALSRVEAPFRLQASHVPDGEALDGCVVWDTPDFDSLAAAAYQQGVIEVLALAEVYLLVLSKEKYADLSVSNVLRLIKPLGRPVLICLNKMTADAREVVVRSLRSRAADLTPAGAATPIVIVPHAATLDADGVAEVADAAVHELRAHVRQALQQAADHPADLALLISEHWSEWTAPLRAEQATIAAWHERVERLLDEFIEHYRRDYLEHPQRYDSFRRAAIELLHLLEVPKLSSWMTTARQTVTWPLRQLWTLARPVPAGRRGQHDLGAEATVLSDTLDTLLTGFLRELSRHGDDPGAVGAVWRALRRRVEDDENRLRQTFEAALQAHHREVQREIQAAADSLYAGLQKQPARLAALRTARASLDAGALLLAVKSGGLTALDAVWAPATFALSSLLMEGFAGAQMTVVARQLKQRQLAAVQSGLVRETLAPTLHGLADELRDDALLGLSAERLARAEEALKKWRSKPA